MKNASAALISLLNSNTQLYVADLLTILPATGSPTYLTSSALDITIESQVDGLDHTFKAGGYDSAGDVRPTFKRGAVTTRIGTQVDTMALTLMSNVLATVDSLPWTEQVMNGYLDGALICLERAFTATWGTWTPGTLITFWGRVGKALPTRNTIALTVNSDLVLLNRPMPRNVYMPACLHNVYDAGCGLVKASLTDAGTATGASTASAIQSNLVAATGYYDLGGITFTSGANDGLTRTVKYYVNATGYVAVSRPFPVAPANGDTFDIVPGCNKQQITCSGKFSNLANFRGFPYVPTPEAGS